MGIFTIGLIQMSCSTSRSVNREKTLDLIRDAVERGADLVCLQELFSDLYFPQEVHPQHYALAEPIPGPTTDWLSKTARKFKVVIIGSVFEEMTRGLGYNTAVILDGDGLLVGKVRKNHIPDGLGYHEKYYFVPGDSGYPVFDLGICRLGVATCWDQWFPEVARMLTLNGAEIILYPTAIGSEPVNQGLVTRDAWQLVMKAHAVTNGVFVGAVNRVGTENKILFYGSSFLSDPFGRIIAEGGDSEEVIVAEVDLKMIMQARDSFHFLRDRRIDTYGSMLKKWVE